MVQANQNGNQNDKGTQESGSQRNKKRTYAEMREAYMHADTPEHSSVC